MDPRKIIFAANASGQNEVKNYIIDISRKSKIQGPREAVELFERISALKSSHLDLDAVKNGRCVINIYILCHEQHRIAYAMEFGKDDRIILLTAFNERDHVVGIQRAERIAEIVFNVDTS